MPDKDKPGKEKVLAWLDKAGERMFKIDMEDDEIEGYICNLIESQAEGGMWLECKRADCLHYIVCGHKFYHYDSKGAEKRCPSFQAHKPKVKRDFVITNFIDRPPQLERKDAIRMVIKTLQNVGVEVEDALPLSGIKGVCGAYIIPAKAKPKVKILRSVFDFLVAEGELKPEDEVQAEEEE